MYRVTQELTFCYGHRLLHYQGKCARLHGHNGKARITLRAESLDGQGMVADFDAIERVVRVWVDETLDHRLLLHRDDPVIASLRALGEEIQVVGFNPTAENIARMIYDFVERKGFPVERVELVETDGSIASFSR